MDSIVLIGPRGSGKSSVGKILASQSCLPFVDADIKFVEGYGSIADFVAQHGWEGFRRLETKMLAEICTCYAKSRIILAAGGGAVAHNQGEQYRRQNVSLLRSFGLLFYLLPFPDLVQSAAVLADRVASDTSGEDFRPKLNEKERLAERHPHYIAAANFVVYTGLKPPAEVANDIRRILLQETTPNLLECMLTK